VQQEASLINADCGAALTPGFFQLEPSVGAPVRDGVFISLAGTAGRLLRAPLTAAQHTPDSGGAIEDAKMLYDHNGNTAQGPEFIPKAMGTSPLAIKIE
jgi:hypothetical protein